MQKTNNIELANKSIDELTVQISQIKEDLKKWWSVRKRNADLFASNNDYRNAERQLSRDAMPEKDLLWLTNREGTLKVCQREKARLKAWIVNERKRLIKVEQFKLEKRSLEIQKTYQNNLAELDRLKRLPELVRELAEFTPADMIAVKSIPLHCADLAFEAELLVEKGITVHALDDLPQVPEDFESNLDKLRTLPSLRLNMKTIAPVKTERNKRKILDWNESARVRLTKAAMGV